MIYSKNKNVVNDIKKNIENGCSVSPATLPYFFDDLNDLARSPRSLFLKLSKN
jgi:hypothetical protein